MIPKNELFESSVFSYRGSIVQIIINDDYRMGVKIEGRWHPLADVIKELEGVDITVERLLCCGFIRHTSEGVDYYARSWGKDSPGTEIVIPETPYKPGMAYQLGKGLTKIFYHVHKLQKIYNATTEQVLPIDCTKL